jgi:hypothetical protein
MTIGLSQTNPNPYTGSNDLFNPRKMQMGLNQPIGNTFNGYGSQQAQKMFDPMENLRAMYKMRGAQPPANLGNTNDGFNGFGSQQAQKMFDPVKKTQMFNQSRGMSQ